MGGSHKETPSGQRSQEKVSVGCRSELIFRGSRAGEDDQKERKREDEEEKEDGEGEPKTGDGGRR